MGLIIECIMEEKEMVQPDAQREVPLEPLLNKPSAIAVWILVVVTVLVAVLVITSKKSFVSENLSSLPQKAAPETLCYYESPSSLSGYADEFALKLTIVDGSATGELITAPAQKDRMVGTLEGVLTTKADELIFDGWYKNEAEGMKNIDERVIRLSENKAYIGYGEMLSHADGSYSYKDPAVMQYWLPIARVDCAIYDQVVTLRAQ